VSIPVRLVPFAYGFRPFFLLAGWFAVLGMGAWLWLYTAGLAWPGGLPTYLWHGHEMLFGFVAAAIAGFMLTAVPSWTGSRGFAGLPLVVLTGIWLLGRMAVAASGVIPFAALAVIELSFLPGLALLVAPPLLRSRNRNTPLLLILLALWTADAVFLLGIHLDDPTLSVGALHFALNLVLLLITVIGGRIVPAFTTNALRQRGADARLLRITVLERLVIGAMAAMLVIDIFIPRSSYAGVVALIAGLGHGWRLAGWKGHRTLGEPIVWVLHLAYAWLPLGLLLKAAWLLGGFAWAAFWLHSLGIGVAATMILAVMSRASLGHTGRPLKAAPAMAWSYLLVVLAAAVRVFGPVVLPLGYNETIVLAGALWIGAFLIYSVVYTPILVLPRVDSRPG
jgi:uncharacterized protein involved in response to NO